MSVITTAETENMTPVGQQDHIVTGEELYRMEEIGPAELVRGEIIYKMPTGHPHGFIENVIGALLYIYLQANKIGRAFTGEIGIYTHRNPDTIRAADVAFISNERFQRVQPHGYLDVAPELVVEIMSPSNMWSEVQGKLAEYFGIDVKMVWVVDPLLEQVHVYTAVDKVALYRKTDVVPGDDVLPGFELSLAELFAPQAE